MFNPSLNHFKVSYLMKCQHNNTKLKESSSTTNRIMVSDCCECCERRDRDTPSPTSYQHQTYYQRMNHPEIKCESSSIKFNKTNCANKNKRQNFLIQPTLTLNSNNKMLMFAIILLVLLSICHATQYIAPGDCTWTHIPMSSSSLSSSNFDVSLKCNLRTINSAGLNFSLIQSEHTHSLSVICDDSLFESRLDNGSLSHLQYLKSLIIENCKLPDLKSSALLGLDQLKNLTIRTHNNDWGSFSLELTQDSLQHLKHLEHLDLGFNNMAQLPQDLFCSLSTLKALNLTNNRLSGFGSFGLIDPSTGQLCLQELQRLDLSYNHITFLSETGVASLKNLHSLYLENNRITEIAELSLSALAKLSVIDLSNNNLMTIASKTFRESEKLKELYLRNNSLTQIRPGLFKGLSKLVILDLSYNEISSEWMTTETFADLIRCVVLDLGHNRIKTINSSQIFQNQYSLQILNLNNNEIDQIGDNLFLTLYNLHTLVLSGNRLKQINEFTFNGLFVLSKLSLAENEISTIHDNVFINCSNLQDLYLQGNIMNKVPKAILKLRFLKTLDLSNNEIFDINNSSFTGLQSLRVLNLTRNEITNITRGTLKELPSLRLLDLSENRITNLEHGLFDDAPALNGINLQGNLLSDINGLFMNLNHLTFLNVSRNRITWFDYALIPRNLIQLDIHHNQIEALGNYFELESSLKLTHMDVSHNEIKEIHAALIPNRIEWLNLSHNKIRNIQPFTFTNKFNISFVDLTNNSLQSLDNNALRLKAPLINKPSAEFFVASNPYFCDCTMDWLQRINTLDSQLNQLNSNAKQYPKMTDLELIQCQLPFSRQNHLVPLTKANSSNFLCKYKSHCFALCHCCDFDACDCEQLCPENCTCFYDATWNTNIVDCSARGYNSIPSRIPMDVTALYLDGNDIYTLTSHTFIGRKNMLMLYLNNSNIHHISNRTFNGLVYLESLHLEYNQLTQLHGYEFDSLVNLKELHLHHNRINVIQNSTFIKLKSLEILHLEYNSIVEYQIWNLNHNTKLTGVYLSHNLWSCKCEFLMEDFQFWIQRNRNIIIDVDDTRCHYNSTAVGPFVWDFNSSSCANYNTSDSTSTIGLANNNNSKQSLNNNLVPSDYLLLIVLVPSITILVIILIILFCVYRKEIKVWMYSKYGVRLFQRSRHAPETEKLFDSFVSYCKKDEVFIHQILAPELECGHPPYHLCLRYRDLTISSGYLAEAMTEAIECSHRTIVLLSEQYLKSDWCRFELKAAHQETLCNKQHRIVVVLLDKNTLNQLDDEAKMCLNGAPIIRWGDRRFWEKLRYAMPPGRGQLNKPMNCPDVRASLEFKRAMNSIPHQV